MTTTLRFGQRIGQRLGSLLAFSLLVAGPALAEDTKKTGETPQKTAKKKDLPKKKAPVKKIPRKPVETLQQRIDRLIGKLSAEEYEVREKAQKELLRIGRPALPSLRKAAQNSEDAEARSLAGETVELITKGNRRDADRERPNPRDGLRRPGERRGMPRRVPTPRPEELLKELQKQLPKGLGKAFERFFEKGKPGQDQERSGRFHSRVRVWSWTNVPRGPRLKGLAGRLGFKVGPTSAVLRAQLAIPRGQGLVINQVVPKGHGVANGVRLYDVVVAVDGRPVHSRRDLVKLADKGGKVEVYRQAKLIKLVLPPAPQAEKPAKKAKPAAKKSGEKERDF